MAILLRMLLLPLLSVVSDVLFLNSLKKQQLTKRPNKQSLRGHYTTMCNLPPDLSSTNQIDWSTLLLIGLSDYFRAL
jgi:hypothetical protein